jgi:NADPH2:quinone reductase
VIARTADQYGGYATHAIAMADALVPVPSGLRITDAAALIHDGLTAMIVFDAAEVKPGDHVLITAAAGGLGSLLVQLAHAAGAHVTAACGPKKLELVTSLGADVAIDYTVDGWPDSVPAADVILDGAGGEIGAAAFERIKPGGRVSAHGAPAGSFAPIDPELAQQKGITLRGITDIHAAMTNANALTTRALDAAATGHLTPVIGRTYPLDEAAAAHTAIESREVLGKALLLV